MLTNPHLSFEHLVKAYQDRVYGYACYMLGDPEEAADVTQEVLLRLWRHSRQVEAERALPWLLHVARNACLDALRKRKVQRRLRAADPQVIERAAGDEPSPADAAEAADFRQHLQHALTQLPEPHRSIVILREIQELKYEEISGAMDLPLGTVKVYLHRARKMLRERLREVMSRETREANP